MIFFSKIKRVSIPIVKFIFILAFAISSFPALATEYSGSNDSGAENLTSDYSTQNTEARRRLDIGRKTKPVASRSAKLAPASASDRSVKTSASSARPKISASRRHKPTPSRQAAVAKAKDAALETSGEEQKAKPSGARRSRTFGIGIARQKIGEGAAPKKKEVTTRVFRTEPLAISSPVTLTIAPGSNTTAIATDIPQLDSRGINLSKEYPEIVIATGQDTAQLNHPPIVLDKKKIEPIQTITAEVAIAEPTKPKATAKPRRARTFGVGIARKQFSTSATKQNTSEVRVFRLPAAVPRPKPVEITPGNDTTIIVNDIPQLDTKLIAKDTSLVVSVISTGQNSTTLVGPPPVLGSKKIAVDTTEQQQEIPSGLNTTISTTITPQLDGKLIARDLSISEPVIITGQDSTSLGAPHPMLNPKKIAVDTTQQQQEIPSGLNTTISTTITPQLDGKLIAKDLSISEPVIITGQDSTSLGAPHPMLNPKKIATDTTEQQQEILSGLNTTISTTIAPQLGGKLIARDLSISEPVIAGQDSTTLGVPPVLDIRVIGLDKTLTPSKINSGLNSTALTTPPQLIKKSILPNRVISNPIIISGQDTIKFVEPPVVLDSRKITTSQTTQQLNIKSGNNSATVTNSAPILAPKRITADTTSSNVTIAPGNNSATVTNPAPILAPKRIAADTTSSNVTIAPGNNSATITTSAPILAPKRIAADTTASNVTIAPGNNSATVTNPAPILAPKRIAADTTASNVTIAPGNDPTAMTSPAPVLASTTITTDTTIAASSTNSTSVSSLSSSSSYQSMIEKESTLIKDDEISIEPEVSSTGGGGRGSSTTPSTKVKNIVKVAAEHYVKNVGSYAIDSIDAITGIIANRLDGLFKPSAIAVAAGDNPNILEKGVWLKIFGSKTIQDGHAQNNARFENKQQGFVLGADIDFKGEVTGGIAFSMNDSNTDFFSNINNYQESKLYSGILYGEFSMWDDFAINTQLKYGHSFIKHSILTDSPIRGETRGSIFGASLEGVYKFISNRTQITPLARVSYTSYDIYDFMEKNKQDNIRIHIPNKKASMMSVFGSLSFKRNFPFKTLQIEPEFHFGVERVMNISHSTDVISIITDNVQLVSAKFVHPTKMRYNFGGNLYFVSRRGLRFGLGGDYMYGKNFRSQAMFANVLLNF